MPRLARLDAPGILQHIIIRGIERRRIFRSNKDKDNFADRLSILLPETQTACYAWAFMSNHAHFLFRSGGAGISTLMRRLLTGYELKSLGYDLDKICHRVSKIHGLDKEEVYSKGRRKNQVKARDLLCYWAVRKLGVSCTDMAKRLGMSQPGVGYAVSRGKKTAKKHKLQLFE